MLKALRAEMNALLLSVPTRRKPALRRSDAPGALLATDLPFAAEAAGVAAFKAATEEAGWRVFPADNGWLLLDKPVPVPEVPAIPAAGECGCCLSLLCRHPEDGEAAEFIREAVRAAEMGPQAFDRFCARLHGEMAAMLRRHEPLPGSLIPYLTQAWIDLEDGRKN